MVLPPGSSGPSSFPPNFPLPSLARRLLFPVCVSVTLGFSLSLHCSSVPQNSRQEIGVENLLSERTGTCVKMNHPSNCILGFTVSLKQEFGHTFLSHLLSLLPFLYSLPSTPVPRAFCALFSLPVSVAGPGRAWAGAPGLSLQICA